MENRMNEIDKLFTEGLEGLEAPLSAKVWQGIEQHLDNKRYDAMRKKYDRLKYLLLLLLLAFTGTTIFLLQGKKENNLAQNTSINSTQSAATLSNNNFQSTTNNQLTNTNIEPPQEATITNKQANTILSSKTTAQPTNNATLNTVALYKQTKNREPQVKTSQKYTPTNTQANTFTQNIAQSNTPVVAQQQSADEENISAIAKNKSRLVKGNASAKVTAGNIAEPEAAAQQDVAKDEKEDSKTTLAKLKKPTVEKKEKDMQYRAGPDQDIAASFRFSISPFIGFNYSKPHIVAGSKEYSSNDYLEIRSKENNGIAANKMIGALINYNISEKWDLQSGIGFVKYKSTVLPQKIYSKTDSTGTKGYKLNTSNGTVYLRSNLASPAIGTDTIQTSYTTTKTNYVMVPLTAQYKIPAGNFIFGLQGGVYGNVLTKQWLETTISKNGVSETKTANKIEGLRLVYFNAAIGGNIEYLLSNRVSIYASPLILVPITSINKNTPAKTTRAGTNVLIGVKLRF